MRGAAVAGKEGGGGQGSDDAFASDTEMGIVVARSRSGAAPRRTTAIRPAQEHGAGSFQERQHDEHLRLHLPRLRRTPGSPTPRRQPGHVLHTLLLGFAHHLPAGLPERCDFLPSDRDLGDVDNSAHVQAVASLTGLALPQARALLRAPAGWRSQAWHTRSRRCRRRLPGPDWSSGSSRHFRGDPRRPMRAIPARGRCRAQAGRRHLIQAQLDQVQQGPYTRAGRMPMAIHGQQLQGRRPQFQRHLHQPARRQILLAGTGRQDRIADTLGAPASASAPLLTR